MREVTDFNLKVKRDAKPCPFCGAKPRLALDPMRDMYRLGCKNSECQIRPQTPVLIRSKAVNDLIYALKVWNTRAEVKKQKEGEN